MAIWVNNDTRLVVQGITGQEGTFHALGCRDYGTQVVAGVTPGKGGQSVEGIPVFDSVEQARAETGCNASMIFVPPPLQPTPSWSPRPRVWSLWWPSQRGFP